LCKGHGYLNLDINALIRDENERKTAIGREINNMVAGNKVIPANMIVKILQKIIYAGNLNQT
jgi:adenylate kinase family enzyme